MGGEKLPPGLLQRKSRGSPPRGRGKAPEVPDQHLRGRITPAWAGKRFSDSSSLSTNQDHPRVGGEKHRLDGSGPAVHGSPPRGRGKGHREADALVVLGITPAWAGKRQWQDYHAKHHRDHPRVGGEKSFSCWCCGSLRGSPPRGRGKAELYNRVKALPRITPAWAGKRSSGAKMSALSRDHPRVGGEKWLEKRRVSLPQGSPPRGRGKVLFLDFACIFARITPAWAGKSSAGHPSQRCIRDHPRVGGEKAAMAG